MKYIIISLLSIVALHAESMDDFLFPVRLTIDSGQVLNFRFEWKKDTNSLKYNISKKLITDSSFGRPVAVLPPYATSFTDSSVSKGLHYEYKIENFQTEVSAYNYIAAGVDIPIKEKTSILLLIADNTDLPKSFSTYTSLLSTEFLNVYQREVPASLEFESNKVHRVKEIIKEEKLKDPTITYLVLIGNVPIPYSGNFSPDNHKEHIGAFPADVWYSELDGEWTDEIINADSALAARQYNYPNDGKFDNYYLPSKSELITSRIDFRNLPAFSETEEELLDRYFTKNIRYRTAEYQALPKAFLSDGFYDYAGYPSSAIYNQYASLFGVDSITQMNMRDSMSSGSYSMAYACGSGGYNSVYLTLYSEDMTSKEYDAVFLACFGSWLCDWDSENNLLRSAIASRPNILCSWFSNRPQVPLHSLGLGRTIGEQIYIAQNNKTVYEYWFNIYQKGVHLELMGDPTLKLKHIAMPNNLSLEHSDKSISLEWEPSKSALAYNIYKSEKSNSLGLRINSEPVKGNSFIDYEVLNGKIYYTITSVEKVNTLNGSYYDESTGIRDSIENYGSEDILIYVQNPIYSGMLKGFTIVLSEKGSIRYILTNLEGKVISKGYSDFESYNHIIEINKNLYPSTYFLRIVNSKGIEAVSKFVVVR